jgi:hypothetical protein
VRTIVRSAPLAVAEYFPSRIELQDPMLIATGIGVVLLHQGPVSSFQLGRSCRAGHPQHLIGITGRL